MYCQNWLKCTMFVFDSLNPLFAVTVLLLFGNGQRSGTKEVLTEVAAAFYLCSVVPVCHSAQWEVGTLVGKHEPHFYGQPSGKTEGRGGETLFRSDGSRQINQSRFSAFGQPDGNRPPWEPFECLDAV